MSKRKLRSSKNEISDEASMEILNDDCLRHIFGYLNQRQLVGIERVCKRWRRVSQKCWFGRTSLELVDVGVAQLRNVLAKCGKYLTSLKFESGVISGADSLTSLQVIGEYCKELQELSLGISWGNIKTIPAKFLNAIKNLKSLSLRKRSLTGLSDSHLGAMLTSANNLETLVLHDSRIRGTSLLRLNEKCRHIELSASQYGAELLSPRYLAKLLQRLTKLEVLKGHRNLIHGSILFHLSKTCKHLDLTSGLLVSPEEINQVLHELTSLEELNLFFTNIQLHPSALSTCSESLRELHLPRTVLASADADSWPFFPNLQILRLNDCTFSIHEMLAVVVPKCPNIEELDISRSSCGLNEIKQLVRLPNLKHVKITKCRDMEDACLRHIGDHMSDRLLSFECTFSHFITDNELLNLLERCPDLIEFKPRPHCKKEFIEKAVEITSRRSVDNPVYLYLTKIYNQEYKTETGKLTLKVIPGNGETCETHPVLKKLRRI